MKIFVLAKIESKSLFFTFLIFVTSPYYFEYTSMPLFDGYPTPRLVSFVIANFSIFLFLKNKLALSALTLSAAATFHFPTCSPLFIVFLFDIVLFRSISRRSILTLVTLLVLPFLLFATSRGSEVANHIYTFHAPSEWFDAIMERNPDFFYKNFSKEKVVAFLIWYLIFPCTCCFPVIFSNSTKRKKIRTLFFLLFPFIFAVISQALIDIAELPISMLLRGFDYVKIALPYFLLYSFKLIDGLNPSPWALLLLILAIILRDTYLPLFISAYFLYAFSISHYPSLKLSLFRPLGGLRFLIFFALLFANVAITKGRPLKSVSDGVVFGISEWMHPHYGLRLEPFIWRTKLYSEGSSWQSPVFSKERLEVLNFVRDHSSNGDLALILRPDSEDFLDFRSRTNVGLYWDTKSGGAFYYNDLEYLREWKRRRSINNKIEAYFFNDAKLSNEDISVLLKEIEVMQIKWLISKAKINPSAFNLRVIFEGGDYYLYKTVLAPESINYMEKTSLID